MIPRGVLLVVLERLGYSPNEVQRVMEAVDGESVNGPLCPDCEEATEAQHVCERCGWRGPVVGVPS